MRIPPLDLRPAVFDCGSASDMVDELIDLRAESAFAPDARPLWAALAEVDASALLLVEMRLWIDEFDQPPFDEVRDNGERKAEAKVIRAKNLLWMVRDVMARLHEAEEHLEAERANPNQELVRVRSGSPSRVLP